MAKRVCPPWIGYFLLNPLRKLFENPDKILHQFVHEGMTVLEPGCGMGFFTLPLARLVGPKGRVIAIDIQPKMLSVLARRAKKAALSERIELRQVASTGLGIEDFSGEVDFVAAFHMVHEMPNPSDFFTEVWKALKPGGKVLVIEPKGHVTYDQFKEIVDSAEKIGFRVNTDFSKVSDRKSLLQKPF